MNQKRSGGILLHVSSFPSEFGIGDLGKNARQWIDFLDQTGTQYWQILPLNPTGFGNSPYQGLSAFAGNPLFIDPENLVHLGLLAKEKISHPPDFSAVKVNFDQVIRWKQEIFQAAFASFSQNKQTELFKSFEIFIYKNQDWLGDFALFMTLMENYRFASWRNWPMPLRMREPQAIHAFIQKKPERIAYYQFLQFIFARQWRDIREYANSKGIKVIGDIPIFMGFDCADVWSKPELFQLDENREPAAVAGVPPDFFSETGQLWGNPLYDWGAHQRDNYAWWTNRVKETLKTVDVIRLDHFRGFSGYYRIPAGAKTAESGEWIDGPGEQLFDAMQSKIGELPFIAEDLGVITPDVITLRERYNLPGMRILQFAFSEDADSDYLPHTYPANCVAYTGTHDSDTTLSWYAHATEKERKFCASYLGYHTEKIAQEMIREVWRSQANTVIAPMQDFLGLGGWARMNIPATAEGNWEWRMENGSLTEALANWIKEINIVYDRVVPGKQWCAKEYFSERD